MTYPITSKVSIYFLFIFSVLLAGCVGNNQETSENKNQLEDFETFNKKFHSDSLFQFSRVKFPIEGKFFDGFDTKEWSKENWKFQDIEVTTNNTIKQFEHEVSFSDTLVVEKYWIENSGFQIERKFKLINNSWFLVSYHEMNL